MNRLVSHIEFLLHEHNCVIVPGFGGFVVNTIHSRRDGIAAFHAPLCELVFNRDLTHNDGLLAQSYMRTYDLTFEGAMQKIEKAVEIVKQHLREDQLVELGRLGSFALNDDKRFIYTPASFIRPVFFGLGKASLKPLIQIQATMPSSKAGDRQRRFGVTGIGAAAVVAVLILMFILPVSDTAIDRQSAQMLSETGLFHNKPAQPVDHSATAANVNEKAPGTEQMPIATGSDVITASDANLTAAEVAVNLPAYYIIVGVYQRNDAAEQIMAQLKNEGFSSPGRLDRPGRTDVYAASFDNRADAETYLRKVHKQYPSHSDAWILKR
ncbi:MAG: hypothetical protein PHI70_08785 [Proteiniphilum sp.]|nr:hypothetical protein [Proteiniphilum sp.]MDD4416859.1 hypothetical protein [Proteiniphilum sp.]